jgi:lysophospholipase L1-like esterase
MLAGMLVFLGLASVAAEWGARYYERHRTVPPDYFPQIFYPHRRLRYGLVPGYDYYGWFKINSLGFRGNEISFDKKPETLRVVCLGASTTFDIGSIGEAKPWPEVMETELRRHLGTQSIEVLNLAIPGFTSLDSLIDLQIRVLDLQPDVLIVYQGHNDFVYSFPSASPAESPLYPEETTPRSAFMRWLINHSVLYAKTERPIRERISGLWRALKGAVGLGSSGQITPSERDAGLERGFTDFRSNLISLAAIAEANDIPLVLPEIVLPFPDGAPDGCGVCARLSPLFGNLEPSKVRSMFDRYDGVLAQLAAGSNRVYHVATDGFVPSEDRYYHDPIHFGPEGSIRMGVKLAEALAPILTDLQSTSPAEAEQL